MPYLLNLVYLAVLALVSPWLLLSAWRRGKYRTGYAAKLWGMAPSTPPGERCIWFHAVSVGEVNLLAPLIAELSRRHPDTRLAISTTTRTGYELAAKKYARHTVFYSPLDFSWSVRRAVRRLNPAMLILAELELWPNLIRAVKESGATVAIVNGRLSERSFRGYRRLRPLVARLLRQIDVLGVQNEAYAQRFRDLGASADRVHVTGSLKFDGAETRRENPATCRLAMLAEFEPGDVVLLAGSTQAPEETMAIETFRTLAERWPKLRLVLVPRHAERFDEVAELLEKSGLPWRRRSQLSEPNVSVKTPRILLVDTIGELGAWWGTAHIAFVGGSMGTRGGQNMIEPAAYGAAVCFGPETRNFRDVVQLLLDREAALVVHSRAEVTSFVERCLAEPAFALALGQRARSLVATQLGATVWTMDLLDSLVGPASEVARAA